MKKGFMLVLAVLFIGLPVFAGTTISTTLQAVVGADLNITTTIPGTKAVDPTLTSAALGSVTISSNVASWTITVHSANGGKMVRAGGGDYPYTFTWGATTGLDLSTDYVQTKTAPQAATTYNLAIAYQTAASLGLSAGTYEDTLTITLATL